MPACTLWAEAVLQTISRRCSVPSCTLGAKAMLQECFRMTLSTEVQCGKRLLDTDFDFVDRGSRPWGPRYLKEGPLSDIDSCLSAQWP